jgi:uncharacterized protein YkwD
MTVVRTLHRKLAVTTALGLSALLVLGIVPVRPAAQAADLGPRREMLSLTNTDRDAHDRADLAFAAKLSRYAKQHSQAMAEAGYLFHSSTDQMRNAFADYAWSMGGENVGVGSSFESLEGAFMASRDHRENILRPEFDHAAIGVARADGRVWVTVLFYG